jgi:hypothetical protein
MTVADERPIFEAGLRLLIALCFLPLHTRPPHLRDRRVQISRAPKGFIPDCRPKVIVVHVERIEGSSIRPLTSGLVTMRLLVTGGGSSPHGLQDHPQRSCVHLIADTQPLPVPQHQLECGSRAAGFRPYGLEQRKSHRVPFSQPFSPVVKRRLSDPALAAERPDLLPARPTARRSVCPNTSIWFPTPPNMPLQQSTAEGRFTSRLRLPNRSFFKCRTAPAGTSSRDRRLAHSENARCEDHASAVHVERRRPKKICSPRWLVLISLGWIETCYHLWLQQECLVHVNVTITK